MSQHVRSKTRVRVAFGTFLAVALLAVAEMVAAGAGAPNPGINVVTPLDGATLAPGDVIPVRVEVAPELGPGTVFVSALQRRSPTFGTTLEGPPYEGFLVVPADVSGEYRIHAFIGTAQGDMKARSAMITVQVIPTDAPQSLEVRSSTSIVHPVDINPFDKQLTVKGVYEGGIKRDITGSQFGTTFTALTSDIVTVDNSGKLTTVAPGYGFILVENQGAKAYTGVIVKSDARLRPGPIERTAEAIVTASGFRRDPKTGRFVQQVTIKNNSTVPFPKALHLVISGLPEGVRLENADGVTRNTTPTGAPLVYVDVEERDFLSPGKTATAVLEFSNRDGIPVTYSTRLYCGRIP
jgi:hypothetical protein